EPHYSVVPRLLGHEPVFAPSGVLMVDADLREATRVAQIKDVLSELHAIDEKLFAVHRRLHHLVAQAYALGATSVVHNTKEAASKLRQVEAAARAAQPNPNIVPTGIADSGQALAIMFSALGRGKALHLADAETVPRRSSRA